MKLAQLLSIYPQLKWGEHYNQEVTSVVDDSRKVIPGSVFVAVRGFNVDGHNYLSSAIANGAIALILEDDTQVPKLFMGAVVKVVDSRKALNQIASKYFGEPAKELFCIGITGTNGKTSTSYLIEEIFKEYGWLSGVMGTIDHHVGSNSWKTNLTTPGVLELHRRLKEFDPTW